MSKTFPIILSLIMIFLISCGDNNQVDRRREDGAQNRSTYDDGHSGEKTHTESNYGKGENKTEKKD